MACSKVGGSNQTTISIGFMCKPHKTKQPHTSSTNKIGLSIDICTLLAVDVI